MMSDSNDIRIVIASDQAISLHGLRSLVMAAEGTRIIGEAKNTADAVAKCDQQKPDLLIFDIKWLAEDTLVAINQILANFSEIMVVFFTPVNSGTQMKERFGQRVCVMSKEISEEEFIESIIHLRKEIIQSKKRASPLTQVQPEAHVKPVMEEIRSQVIEVQDNPIRNTEVITRELVMAGKIQADILPEVSPSIKGWDIAARLIPARETSGDFYDFIPLTDRKIGIVIADVTDKGMGAALFMALSSSLLRTYAYRFPTLPGLTLKAVSDRILSDTRGNMFITAIFGVLEPHTGRYIYANAGHPPGYQITTQKGHISIHSLRPTGMALGISEQAQWKQKEIRLSPGDVLVLYTDGVIETQNAAGEFLEEDLLLDTILSEVESNNSNQILEKILQKVQDFSGKSFRHDDVAIIVIRREPE